LRGYLEVFCAMYLIAGHAIDLDNTIHFKYYAHSIP
jgi:hypothetical protein